MKGMLRAYPRPIHRDHVSRMWTSSLTISRARHHGPMNAPVDIPKNLFVCIDHVGIAVPDLDEAIAFYRDAFGMEVAHEEVNEEQGVREAMVQDRKSTRLNSSH